MAGKFKHLLLLTMGLGAVLILVILSFHFTSAQMSGKRYFPETGHEVSGEFLDLYESVDNPLLVYGYPITDAYQDKSTGHFVQYFEKARFELDPEGPASLFIKRTLLGALLYIPGPVLPVAKNHPDCQYFSETDVQVCFAFLDFFLKNGKEAQFGFPISNFEIHDNRVVQYFQLARLEWHPENPPEQRVKLANLGWQYFNEMKENPQYLQPKITENTLQFIIKIQARSFPEKSIVRGQATQSIYVIVRDQSSREVKDAQVAVEVHFPSGAVIKSPGNLKTDESGVASFSFDLPENESGQVVVQSKVIFRNLEDSTSTSFLIWR